jgi:hypothetical protein
VDRKVDASTTLIFSNFDFFKGLIPNPERFGIGNGSDGKCRRDLDLGPTLDSGLVG